MTDSTGTLVPFNYGDAQVRVVTIEGEPCLKGAEHHLYIVEFVDHGIKVGITGDPNRRLATHRRDAEAFGRPVGRAWVSPPHVEARSNEKALKALSDSATRREYINVPFDDALATAARLPMRRADRAAVEADRARALSTLQSILLPGVPR